MKRDEKKLIWNNFLFIFQSQKHAGKRWIPKNLKILLLIFEIKKSQLKDCFPLHFCFPLLLSAYFYYFTFFLSHFSSSHHKRKQPTMWISFIGWLVYYHIISNIDLYAHTHTHSHSYILTLFLSLFHSFHSLCYSLSLSLSFSETYWEMIFLSRCGKSITWTVSFSIELEVLILFLHRRIFFQIFFQIYFAHIKKQSSWVTFSNAVLNLV